MRCKPFCGLVWCCLLVFCQHLLSLSQVKSQGRENEEEEEEGEEVEEQEEGEDDGDSVNGDDS